MTKYEGIYEIAADKHGLITSAEARELGITNNELVQYARRGRIKKVGHGLYQLVRWVPEDNDAYAWAVAAVGPDAVLCGESVIAMLGLAPTNPARIFVATPKRVRRKLPDGLVAIHVNGIEPTAVYDSIPCQSAAEAIRFCMRAMMAERLRAAADEARRQGYISQEEHAGLIKELSSDGSR